ncbi:hypothetical protein R2B67_35645 [Streptomyces cyaneofuscatus]|uniref:hypothetical protein n=1 Tax=Streptomyces cyaneofuscatus TaxID=66883 RepID=UPI002954A933|nr:hypothetical protein [Streptomyces cyaneofuscatus]WOP13555.1 hypothetical protein R2B67_35645 [Streptomyces cyaneofuscatus]
MLELDLRGQQSTGAVCDLKGQGPPQDERIRRNGSQPETGPLFAVDPLEESFVTAVAAAEVEGRGKEVGCVGAGEFAGDAGRLVGLGGDDPFVPDAPVLLSLDQLALEAVPDPAGSDGTPNKCVRGFAPTTL